MASLLLLFFLCNLLRFSLACDPIRFPRIDQAHALSKGGGTIVAIVDHGFDLRSKELAPVYFRPATFGQDRGERYYGSGHGHWMARLLHAAAPEARIMPLTIIHPPSDPSSGGFTDYLQELFPRALRYAADNGAVALSSSWMAVEDTKEMEDAVEYAARKGLVYVYINYQGKNPKVIKPDSCLPHLIEPCVDCAYRESDIVTCGHSPFVYRALWWAGSGWGRSNAAPVVAGVTALMKNANPRLSVQDVKRILIETARKKGRLRLLDAYEAVKMAQASKRTGRGAKAPADPRPFGTIR